MSSENMNVRREFPNYAFVMNISPPAYDEMMKYKRQVQKSISSSKSSSQNSSQISAKNVTFEDEIDTINIMRDSVQGGDL